VGADGGRDPELVRQAVERIGDAAVRCPDDLRHHADDDTGAGERQRLAAFLLLGSCGSERTSSIWPLKGSAMPLTCRLMPREAELGSMGCLSLICAIRAPLR
jgi:hypothetical protein